MWPFKKSLYRTAPEVPPAELKSYTLHDGDKLTSEETTKMLGGPTPQCPDCGSTFLAGPSGGLSVNVACSNKICSSRFNVMGPFGINRISEARPGTR